MINVNGSKYKIRKACDKDLSLLSSWYKEQGWENRNLFTPELDHCVVMVAVDENDTPVSTVSYMYVKKCTNLNSFVTDPKYRGNGLGRVFWDYVLNQFGNETNLYLKSVDPMTEKYRIGSGFSHISTVHCRRYVGHLTSSSIRKFLDENLHITIKDVLDDSSISAIIKYDTENIHQEDCSKFLNVWLNHSQRKKDENLVYTVYANGGENHVIGYGSIFRCSEYLRIGPLFADNFNIFLQILHRLVGYKFAYGQQPEIYELTVPSTNFEIIDFLLLSGLTFKKPLNRSFTKNVEDLNYEKIYCFTGHTGVPE